MSFPNDLVSVDANSYRGTTDVYKKYSTDSNYAYYDAWMISNNRYRLNNRDWSIKIGINSANADYKQILDNGPGDPSIFPPAIDSNGVVTLSSSSYPNWYKFDDPNFTSSGGGTSTEEVFVPDAKIVNYGGLTGLRFEQRGYPAASYELTGPGASSTWTLTSQSNNLQHHISNLSAGTYYLWQDSVQVATLIASDNKKVFCNFW